MCAWIKQQVYWSAIVISSTWPTDQVNFQPHRHGYSCSLQIQMQHLAQTVHCRKQFGQWAPGLTHHLYLGLINLHLNSGPFLLPSSSSSYKNGNKINTCGTIQLYNPWWRTIYGMPSPGRFSVTLTFEIPSFGMVCIAVTMTFYLLTSQIYQIIFSWIAPML